MRNSTKAQDKAAAKAGAKVIRAAGHSALVAWAGDVAPVWVSIGAMRRAAAYADALGLAYRALVRQAEALLRAG